MSLTSLPTNGRVLIQTTLGDIEVELWSRECPKACRNFIALALEGYYDGVIFHRVVPDFMVQTGDRSGTGNGGDSFYGEPFEDEFHPRLRFTHRGLVAMANNGERDSNMSQFFITLARADELQGKHTLFGRVVGDTIYNVLKIGQLELGPDERPIYPPSIRTIKILDDPFGDIIPRITAAEKRVQQLAKEKARHEREEASKRKAGKKDAKLLSFGIGGEDEGEVSFKKKPIFRPDLLDDGSAGATPIPASTLRETVIAPKQNASPPATPKPDSEPIAEPPIAKKEKKKDKNKDPVLELDARKAELERIESEVRKLTRRRDSDDEEEDTKSKKKARTSGPSFIELQNAKYKRGSAAAKRQGRKKDESDILATLSSFRGKLQNMRGDSPPAPPGEGMETDQPEEAAGPIGAGGGEEGLEVDDDVEWLSHRLQFPKDNGQESARAEHDYEVIDPRARGARAKEEEKARRKDVRDNRRDGGRGYRPPAPRDRERDRL